MKLNFSIDGISFVEMSDGSLSAKVGNARLCNIYYKYGDYMVKCRSKRFADLLPVAYTFKRTYEKTRDYYTYFATVTEAQLHDWLIAIKALDISKRLDNR